jgi:uncharacterized membrane protein SpoIIM required for sporulation
MREITFLKDNADKWQAFENKVNNKEKQDPDEVANLYIQLTNDLAFSKTHYPNSRTTQYLNGLASQTHQLIYKNKKEKKGRIISFWVYELPLIVRSCHKQLLYSFLIFVLSGLIGWISAAYDDSFVRLILGDTYVNMTLDNINNNDPMAVYKKMNEMDMFLAITVNNVYVSFLAFVLGIFFSIGTGYALFNNGVMLGSFQYFFLSKGVLLQSLLTIWIHGTLEISAIVIAGGAGLVLGNSILFPGTYSRGVSFVNGAKKGIKIIIGLIPIFILAGFLEGFVTRHTEMPVWLSLIIIGGSLTFIVWYFIIYPIIISKKYKI